MGRLEKIFITAAALLWSGSVNAFVAQDASSALSYQNYGRDGVADSSARKGLPDYVSYGGDVNVDHAGIAEKMIGKGSSEMVSVDFRDKKTTLQAMFPTDYNFKVILPETEGSRWMIDHDKSFIEQVDSQSSGKMRIVEFRSLKAGQTVIYFDNMTTSMPYKSLQSRVLRIRIVK